MVGHFLYIWYVRARVCKGEAETETLPRGTFGIIPRLVTNEKMNSGFDQICALLVYMKESYATRAHRGRSSLGGLLVSVRRLCP